MLCTWNFSISHEIASWSNIHASCRKQQTFKIFHANFNNLTYFWPLYNLPDIENTLLDCSVRFYWQMLCYVEYMPQHSKIHFKIQIYNSLVYHRLLLTHNLCIVSFSLMTDWTKTNMKRKQKCKESHDQQQTGQ